MSRDAALDVSVQAAILKLLHGRIVERGETRAVLAAPQTDYGRELMAAVPRFPTGSNDNSGHAS